MKTSKNSLFSFRKLTPSQIQTFIDRLFIFCPNCQTPLRDVSENHYVICTDCNIHLDLVLSRNLPLPDHETISRFRPDGSLYRRKVELHGQLTLFRVSQ